jgi:acetaldehyde dehydrogenase (acetylating)
MDLDKDLAARQEARMLCKQAEAAQKVLSRMDQHQLDKICEAIAKKFAASAAALADAAVNETKFGNSRDKEIKNRFASETVWEAIKDLKTVGILQEDPQRKLWEIGVPVGVIAAIVPSTNPTSTICYKALIALKSGNSIVFSPHPKALSCSLHAAQIVAQAAEQAGAPKGSIGCLSLGAMAGTEELMSAKEVRLILATGGTAMVRAAYSSGKPAIGVGAGNGPAYIHHSANISRALDCIIRSKSFDYGTVCASEQSIIIEKRMEETLLREAKAKGIYLMSTEEAGRLAKLLFRPNGALSPDVVGKPATKLAEMAGFSVPENTKILMAREQEAGPTRPYSMEKLCPVLAFFVMDSEEQVLEKSVEVLSHEGSGHTFAMHCGDRAVIERFALQIPVSRFLVNTPAALGGIGESTALFPALTLGCGAVGGSSSSNNISPMDLVNIRRVAWDNEKTTEAASADNSLVDVLVTKILERLSKNET